MKKPEAPKPLMRDATNEESDKALLHEPARTGKVNREAPILEPAQSSARLAPPHPEDTPLPAAPLQPDVANNPPDETNPVPSAASARPVPNTQPNGSYLAFVQRRISSRWSPPEGSQGLTAVVRFRIDRSGDVSEVEIEQSSGNTYFDLAGKRAVQLASPMPVFSSDVDAPFLNTHMSFSYK